MAIPAPPGDRRARRRAAAEGLTTLASHRLAEGRLSEAEAALRDAIGLDRNCAQAHAGLGVVLMQRGRLDEAEGSVRRAIALHDDFADAHAILGSVLLRRGAAREAEAACRRALDLIEYFPQALATLGLALLRQGRPDAAEAACRMAIDVDGEVGSAHAALGTVLLATGRPTEAQDAFHRAVSLDGTDQAAMTDLGRALLINGRAREAQTAFETALALRGGHHPEAHLELAALAQDQGRIADAMGHARAALALEPRSWRAAVILGLGHLQLALVSEPRVHSLHAVARFDRALALARPLRLPAGEVARIHLYRGTALAALGREREASAGLRSSTRAARVDSLAAEVLTELSRTHSLRRLSLRLRTLALVACGLVVALLLAVGTGVLHRATGRIGSVIPWVAMVASALIGALYVVTALRLQRVRARRPRPDVLPASEPEAETGETLSA